MFATIKKLVIVAIALIAAYSGYTAFNKPADVTYVGTATAFDGLITKRTLVELADGTITVSTCSKEKLATLKQIYISDCIYPEQIGSGDVTVTSVVPAYRAQIRAAMSHSIYYSGLEIVDGLVHQ